ncbi:unnamed protein product [Periconia digitata]|uniref:Uncharacterized protein n=1 Tax=Periconia digitata TaxID=1303443 RepID=A0A9W4XKC2_9PLEO|nr:unnamed protein product [Periconia digitata]
MAPPSDSLARGNDAHNAMAPQPLEQSTHKLLVDRTIEARQQITAGIIPTYYVVDGPAPGTVVGIVFGSVAGFILLCWLIFSLTQGNVGRSGASGVIAGEEEYVVRRARRKSNSHAGRRRSEIREYSRSPRQSGGRSTVIVEERRPAPRARSRSIVMESRRPGDDIVEVIEDHDEYRSARGSRRRSPDYR